MELKEVLERYRRLREKGRDLNSDLLRKVPRAELAKLLKPFGVVRGKTISASETELDVLMDYVLYTYREGRKSLPRVMLANLPPSPGQDRLDLLNAMAAARYTIFRVEDPLQGVGVIAGDFFWQREFPLIDRAISGSASPGSLLAGRLLDLGDFHMTAGAVIPLDEEMMEREVGPYGVNLMEKGWTPGDGLDQSQQKNLSRRLIKAALKSGALDGVKYL